MVKFASIQLHSTPMDLAGNYAKGEEYIRKAAAQGARLAVLPEYYLTSWVPDNPDFARTYDGKNTWLEKFCALAKELNINLVPGTFVEKGRNLEGKETLDNNGYFISNEGKILGKYTKKNLWHTEREHLTSSRNMPHDIIESPELGKLGILMCWDLAFPEAFRELVAKGARIIIVTSFWTAGSGMPDARKRNARHEALFMDTCVVARAVENNAVVIFSNTVGDNEHDYGGCSQIAAPVVGKLAASSGHHEELIVADVDMKVLVEAEECYKIWNDLENPNFHYPRMSSAK